MAGRQSVRAVGGMLLGCLMLAGCSDPAERAASPEPTTPPPATPAHGSTTLAHGSTTPADSATTPTRYPSSTPEQSRTAASKTSPSRTGAAQQSPSPTKTTRATTTAKPVIVIDPGHSGRSIRSTEPSTGLTDFDYPNDPEMDEVYEVSACVADGLRDRGYRVIMTKHSADDTVSLAQRAKIANRADADLAISVHNDHSQRPSFQAVYSQRGLKHDGRYGPMWRGSDANRTVFDHLQVARRSARYAKIISEQRAIAQRRPVAIAEENFTGRSGLEPGNLAMVQLLADVPWVYNEAGALTAGSTTHRMAMTEQARYAEGLLDGVVAAIPLPDDRPGSGSDEQLGSMVSCLDHRRR
ncbi:MAG TPA: N-acetylmuramoyl-L-alanine amidase [Microlunatus sp.]